MGLKFEWSYIRYMLIQRERDRQTEEIDREDIAERSKEIVMKRERERERETEGKRERERPRKRERERGRERESMTRA